MSICEEVAATRIAGLDGEYEYAVTTKEPRIWHLARELGGELLCAVASANAPERIDPKVPDDPRPKWPADLVCGNCAVVVISRRPVSQ